jgi:hypothetical protein
MFANAQTPKLRDKDVQRCLHRCGITPDLTEQQAPCTAASMANAIRVYILYRVTCVDDIQRFAEEVAPGVRHAVAAERTRQQCA